METLVFWRVYTSSHPATPALTRSFATTMTSSWRKVRPCASTSSSQARKKSCPSSGMPPNNVSVLVARSCLLVGMCSTLVPVIANIATCIRQAPFPLEESWVVPVGRRTACHALVTMAGVVDSLGSSFPRDFRKEDMAIRRFGPVADVQQDFPKPTCLTLGLDFPSFSLCGPSRVKTPTPPCICCK